MSRALAALIALVLALIAPVPALADYTLIHSAVNNVGYSLPTIGGMPCTGAGCGFIGIALHIIARFRPLATVIGGLVISFFGIRMMLAQEDDAVTKSRTVMTGVISGLVLIWLVEPVVEAFYGSQGERFQGDIGTTASIMTREVSGIIRWALVLTATVAILMIVISALRAILKPTSDESIAGIKKTLIGVAAGILLLVFHEVIATSFIGNTASPVPLLVTAVEVIKFVMTFLALGSLLALLYAGFTLVFNMGKDEAWQKAKGLFARTAIGFVVIILALALVEFVILPGVS